MPMQTRSSSRGFGAVSTPSDSPRAPLKKDQLSGRDKIRNLLTSMPKEHSMLIRQRLSW